MKEDNGDSYTRVYTVLEATLRFFVDAIPFCGSENVRLFEQKGLLPHNLTRKNTVTGHDESLEQLLYHFLEERHGISPELGRRYFGSVYHYLLDNGVLRANTYVGCLPEHGLRDGVYYSSTTPLSTKEVRRMIPEIMRLSMVYLGLLPGEECDRMLKGTSELCKPKGKPLSQTIISWEIFPRLLRQHGIPYRNGHNPMNDHRKGKPTEPSREPEKTVNL